MTNISLTLPCIDHFNKLYQRKIPIRIGGTTQDRATYDPALKGYVLYSVDDPLEAPMSLTYGPKFFNLIGKSTYYSLAVIYANHIPEQRSSEARLFSVRKLTYLK